jgi:hypothetical protein
MTDPLHTRAEEQASQEVTEWRVWGNEPGYLARKGRGVILLKDLIEMGYDRVYPVTKLESPQ